MMPTKTFNDYGRDADFLMSEAPGRISREQAVLAPRPTRTLGGTVLGIVTANGRHAPLAPAANDGSQTAASILMLQRAADPTNPKRCAIVARDCEVNGRLLIWPAGITDNQKKAAEAALAAKGIIVRY